MSQLIENGQLIQGDFSNATYGSRRKIKTNVANGATGVVVVPDGSGNNASVMLASAADPDNSPLLLAAMYPTEAIIGAAKSGTGAYQPVGLYTSGIRQYSIDTAGRLLNSSLSMPSFYASRAAAIALTVTMTTLPGTWTMNHNYTASFNAASGVFTAPVSGVYAFSAKGHFLAGTAGALLTIRLVVIETGEVAAITSKMMTASDERMDSISVSAIYLTAGQTVALQGYATGGTATAQNLNFSGRFLG